ncbi:hypothetical protein SAMN04487957_11566 [Halomonas shengliensis]|uniref:Uncharacterized protein n=1 Tax=Halomonas shengliensis TaxID=419597 RepID=A0A1H0NH83_9GAMM|nr:hypothetical protein [Halomonas shengliensis]SDO91946.1 hypothetical protein SAMN04487957_11566 [Halomonas shengliensis]
MGDASPRDDYRLTLAELLLAAGLAVWLLLEPELIAALPMALRLPLVLLGAATLGVAFAAPLSPERGRRAPFPAWRLVALVAFALLLGARSLAG